MFTPAAQFPGAPRSTHSITLEHRAHAARKQRTRAIIYGHGGCGSATNQPDRPPILPASSWRAQIDGDSVVNAPYPEPISSCKVDEIGNMAAIITMPSSVRYTSASRGSKPIEEVARADGEWWRGERMSPSGVWGARRVSFLASTPVGW